MPLVYCPECVRLLEAGSPDIVCHDCGGVCLQDLAPPQRRPVAVGSVAPYLILLAAMALGALVAHLAGL